MSPPYGVITYFAYLRHLQVWMALRTMMMQAIPTNRCNTVEAPQ